jgi:Flp pilus assembly protein TadB
LTDKQSEDSGARRRRRASPDLSPEEEARQEAEAVHLGRFIPLGIVAGAVAGAVVGWLVHHPGLGIPIGIAAGLLLAATIPVFSRRR